MTRNAAEQASLPELLLLNATFLLSVNPFIKLLPVDAEIQPLGAITGLALVLGWGTRFRFLGTFTATLTALLAITYLRGLLGDPINYVVAYETYFALLAPVITFGAILGRCSMLSLPWFLANLAGWVFVGICQSLAPFISAFEFMDSLLLNVVVRESSQVLLDSGRGASLIAPEPSYSAHAIVLMLASVLFFHRVGAFASMGPIGRIAFPSSLVGIAFLTIANRSATIVIVMMAIFFFAFAIHSVKDFARGSFRLLFAWTFTIIGVSMVALLYDFAGSELRFAVVVSGVSELLQDPNMDFLAFTNEFGSVRTLSVYIGYLSLLDFSLVGGGLGSWSIFFVDRLLDAGFDPYKVTFFDAIGEQKNIKPYAHTALLAFDAGWIGITLGVGAFIAAFQAIGPKERLAESSIVTSLLAVSVYSIMFGTPVSLPCYWVLIALMISLITHADDSETQIADINAR